MIKIKLDKVTEEELIQEIENSLKKKKFKNDKKKEKNISIARPLNEFFIKNKYNIDELLKYDDKEFIKVAYKTILKRDPDTEGFNYYLNKYREGEFSKKDIIFSLRFSKEGREKGVKIEGIFPGAIFSFLKRIKFFGKVFNTLKVFFKLSDLEKRVNVFDNVYKPLLLEVNHYKEIFKKERIEIYEKIKFLEYNIENIENKLKPLELPSLFQENINYPINRKVSFYESFEELFRGEEYTVKDRLRIYLNYLPKGDISVLDLGCGRGEFLELLKEYGVAGVGVDINKNFVKLTRKKNIKVIEKDAIEFLKDSKKNFDVITAFHLIEHLDVDKQKKLVELAYKNLKDSGKLIIETPNPWYIHSFATFYLDETHIKPIPPEALAFLFQWVGFQNVKIIYLNPKIKSQLLNSEYRIYYQDYAVIGEK